MRERTPAETVLTSADPPTSSTIEAARSATFSRPSRCATAAVEPVCDLTSCESWRKAWFVVTWSGCFSLTVSFFLAE
jgi:hypothetical protein